MQEQNSEIRVEGGGFLGTLDHGLNKRSSVIGSRNDFRQAVRRLVGLMAEEMYFLLRGAHDLGRPDEADDRSSWPRIEG